MINFAYCNGKHLWQQKYSKQKNKPHTWFDVGNGDNMCPCHIVEHRAWSTQVTLMRKTGTHL